MLQSPVHPANLKLLDFDTYRPHFRYPAEAGIIVRRVTPETTAYHELCAYTLSLRDAAFIHQHVVDAFAAQHAEATSKPMGIAFALIGLYLHVERNVSGRNVQRVHMKLARRKRQWPAIALPGTRGSMTALDVMTAEPGPERNRTIDAWCASVWDAYRESRAAIIELLRESGID